MTRISCFGESPALAPSVAARPAPVAAGSVPKDEFQFLQALDDAISYRTARAAEPCADCHAAAGGKCDDHGRDVDLIGEYRAASRRCGERIRAGVP
jgi:hypothetical protein